MMEQTFVIDLFSGQLVVPIDIFHEFFSLGFFINLFSGQLTLYMYVGNMILSGYLFQDDFHQKKEAYLLDI